MKILELRDYAKSLGLKSVYKYKKNELKEMVYDFLNKKETEKKNTSSDTKPTAKSENKSEKSAVSVKPEKKSEPSLIDYAPKSQANQYKQHIEKEKEKEKRRYIKASI